MSESKSKKNEKLAGHLSGATGDKFCCTKLSLYSKSSVAVVCLQCFVFLSVAVQLSAANRAERTTANYKTLKEGAIGISSIREREIEKDSCVDWCVLSVFSKSSHLHGDCIWQ